MLEVAQKIGVNPVLYRRPSLRLVLCLRVIYIHETMEHTRYYWNTIERSGWYSSLIEEKRSCYVLLVCSIVYTRKYWGIARMVRNLVEDTTRYYGTVSGAWDTQSRRGKNISNCSLYPVQSIS